jgi:hypothetical protein
MTGWTSATSPDEAAVETAKSSARCAAELATYGSGLLGHLAGGTVASHRGSTVATEANGDRADPMIVTCCGCISDPSSCPHCGRSGMNDDHMWRCHRAAVGYSVTECTTGSPLAPEG